MSVPLWCIIFQPTVFVSSFCSSLFESSNFELTRYVLKKTLYKNDLAEKEGNRNKSKNSAGNSDRKGWLNHCLIWQLIEYILLTGFVDLAISEILATALGLTTGNQKKGDKATHVQQEDAV